MTDHEFRKLLDELVPLAPEEEDMEEVVLEDNGEMLTVEAVYHQSEWTQKSAQWTVEPVRLQKLAPLPSASLLSAQ